MIQYNEKDNSKSDAYEQEANLRREAEAKEEKERVRRRLLRLTEISQDPYYNQYLAQMMKDLESGKATPWQVSKEADRTYCLYQQRMGQVSQASNTVQKSAKNHNSTEFTITAGIFSVMGAGFILAAMIILGYNFLEGIWQGISLYAVALTTILIAEFTVKRLNNRIAMVIAAIGFAGMYIATIINYLFLKNISALTASGITIVIAVCVILYSHRENTEIIRLISAFGCYLCFLPMEGFETEISFWVMMCITFIINLVLVFWPNQKNRMLIGSIHMIAHTGFTMTVTAMIISDGINPMFVSCFFILELTLFNLIYYSRRNGLKEWYTVLYAIFLGCFAVMLIYVSNYGCEIYGTKMQMLHVYLTEVMAIAVAFIFFILGGKDKCRWIQYYFVISFVVILNGLMGLETEKIAAILLAFVITRLLCREEVLLPLDAIITGIAVIQGIWFAQYGYAILFVIIMALSIWTIKKWYLFHEIILTFFFFVIPLICFDVKWIVTVCIGILFVMFMVFNHLPTLKLKNQLPYNIVNVVFMSIVLLLHAMICDDYRVNIVSMLVGTVAFWVAFRERYGMAVRMKPLFMAIYLCVMICVAGFEMPVVTSAFLMLVALACVGAGLRLKDKACRIGGLVIAVIAGIKMMIFDFSDLDSWAKAILFLIVGMITLIFSFIFIYRKEKEEERIDKK